jgi:hypothetical protein
MARFLLAFASFTQPIPTPNSMPNKRRGRPKKQSSEPSNDSLTPTEPDTARIEGIPPNRFDVEDELTDMMVDPFYAESAHYGRNADDPQGGIGLNFGDW